jgi:hypothetical protein
MNIPNPFTVGFWAVPEPPDNVVYLNTPHGRANARQAAQLLENDRLSVRDDIASNLRRERDRLMDRVEEIDAALLELHSHG